MQQRTNGLAVAGLVLGIIGLVLFWIPVVGAIVAIVGVALAGPAVARAKRRGVGKGMALAGLICASLAVIAGAGLTVKACIAVDHWAEKPHGSFMGGG